MHDNSQAVKNIYVYTLRDADTRGSAALHWVVETLDSLAVGPYWPLKSLEYRLYFGHESSLMQWPLDSGKLFLIPLWTGEKVGDFSYFYFRGP